MKKLVSVLVLVLMFSLTAIPVFASEPSAPVAVYTAEAKSDYPNNFTEIYGITFNVTANPQAWFIASIYVDGDADAPKSVIFFATTDDLATNVQGMDIPVEVVSGITKTGDSTTLTYKSDNPLFKSSDSLAKVRLRSIAFTQGGSYSIDKVTWLGKDGNELKASSGTVSSTPSKASSVAVSSTPSKASSVAVSSTISSEASTSSEEVSSEAVSSEDTSSIESSSESSIASSAASTSSKPDDSEDSNLLWLWIVLGVVVVAGIGACIYFFVIKKKS